MKSQNTEDLSLCDCGEPNLKNFCGKRHAANAYKMKAIKNWWWDHMINIQHISMLRKQNSKGEKQSKSLPN